MFTICVLVHETDETRYTGATPIQDRIDKINKLYDDGHYIVYLTARGMGRFNNSRMHAHREFYEFTYNQLKGLDVNIMNFILVNLQVTIT